MVNPNTLPTVAIENHGCKLNQSDVQELGRQFTSAGFRLASWDGPADVYVLNTCTVTHVADAKARQAVRAVHRRNPSALVVVTGCYAERAPGEVASIDGAQLVVGNRDKAQLVDQVLAARGQAGAGSAASGVSPQAMPPAARTRAMAKIQEGCNQVCAYCIVPKVRGRERSIPQQSLVGQVQDLASQGYREVVLTGTQLGSYGFDRPGESLKGLLTALLQETTVERLRVSSLQPQEIDQELLHLWRNPRLCPHFHVPLQSGSDSVLQRMGRRYDSATFSGAVDLIHRSLPGASVTTDVIAGFPGETDDEFQQTLALCEGADLAWMHVFPYSRRPGTTATYLAGRVEPAVKRERVARMLLLSDRKELAFLRDQVGTVQHVLWEDETTLPSGDGKAWTGHAPNYARVFAISERPLGNAATLARVVDLSDGRLWAEVLRVSTAS